MRGILWAIFPSYMFQRDILQAFAENRCGIRVRWWWSINRIYRAIGAHTFLRELHI